MTRLEPVTLVIGVLCMIAALAVVDWRLGLFATGMALVLSTIDFGSRTRR